MDNQKAQNSFLRHAGCAFLIFAVLSGLIFYFLFTVSEIIPLIKVFVEGIVFEHDLQKLFYVPDILIKLISLACSCYFIFLFYTVLEAIYTYYIYRNLAVSYLFEDFNLKDSVYKAVSWKLYRLGYILFPPFLITVITFITVLLFSIFFNFFAGLAGFSIGLTSFAGIFVFLTLFFGFIISLLLSLWRYITTPLGFVTAISEPHQDNYVIRTRSEKLVTAKKSNIFVYLLNSAYGFVFVYQIYSVFSNPETISLRSLPIIFGIILMNIVLLALLGYLKVHIYIESVLAYYYSFTISRNEYYRLKSCV